MDTARAGAALLLVAGCDIFAVTRESQKVLVWGAPFLPVVHTACLVFVSQGTVWSFRQDSADSYVWHHGKHRDCSEMEERTDYCKSSFYYGASHSPLCCFSLWIQTSLAYISAHLLGMLFSSLTLLFEKEDRTKQMYSTSIQSEPLLEGWEFKPLLITGKYRQWSQGTA